MVERLSVSTDAQTRTQTLKERGADATRRLREALQLTSDLTDTAVLGTALAEYMVEKSQSDPHIAQELRRRYDELVAQNGRGIKRKSGQKETLPPLVPVGHAQPGERFTIDPFAPPDPQFLIRVYGHDQLARALEPYMVDTLKQTASAIERENPGTKPTNRGQKKALIAYIVKYSARAS